MDSVGDASRLALMFEVHRERLTECIARRIDPQLARRADAEQVVQETFLKARNRWREFVSSGMDEFVWLFTLAREQLVDVRRHEHRHRRNVSRDRKYPDQTSVQMVLRIVARATSPSQAAMRAELQQQVRALLECLTDDDRELLMMRHVDGLTLKQAARVLKISHDAALQRHRRALERLKRRWRSQFGEEERPV